MQERKLIRNLLNKLNDDDRSQLVQLLCKAGYCVRIRRDKVKQRTTFSVEFWEEPDEEA